MSYVADLMLRLTAGAARLPAEVRARHAAYLTGKRARDGGFAGRQGAGDLYYTSFALRALMLLGELEDQTACGAAEFLKERLGRPMPSIDFLSLVTAAVLVEMVSGVDVFAEAGHDRHQAVGDFVERFRRDDGGYAKTERSGQGSTYHTFLVALCKQMVGAPLADARQMIELVRSRQRGDGGFVEIAPLRESGTNPTAAAVGLLRLLDGLDGPTREAAARFLAGMQTGEGGLRANTRIPVADLLSTFTGLVTLTDLGAATAIDTAAALRFVRSLEEGAGGFRAGGWDDAADVEYTFYGLGALALLAPAQA